MSVDVVSISLMTSIIQSFNRGMVSKTNMLFLETIPRLKVLTALYEQVFEI